MKLDNNKKLIKIKSFLVKKMKQDNSLTKYAKDIELLNLKSFGILVKIFKKQ